jgi:hypothetical protein
MRKLKREIWPYTIFVSCQPNNIGEIYAIDAWCQKHGNRFDNWYSYNMNNGRLYAFKDEATLLAFKLTWGKNICLER